MPAELGNTSQRQSNHNFIFKSCSLADSAPHPFYTIYTTKSPQKCTKQNAISRKRNTACLYAACLYVCMPPTGCGLHAHPPAAYLPDACLLPVVSLYLFLTSVLIPSVFLPPILLDSAPHPLYTVYTTKCRQKSTKQNAISRKRNTACLYASCLYVRLSPDCLRPACPCSCRLPSWCQKSTTLCKPAKHYQKIIGFKKLRPFSPKEKCIKIFLPLQFL